MVTAIMTNNMWAGLAVPAPQPKDERANEGAVDSGVFSTPWSAHEDDILVRYYGELGKGRKLAELAFALGRSPYSVATQIRDLELRMHGKDWRADPDVDVNALADSLGATTDPRLVKAIEILDGPNLRFMRLPSPFRTPGGATEKTVAHSTPQKLGKWQALWFTSPDPVGEMSRMEKQCPFCKETMPLRRFGMIKRATALGVYYKPTSYCRECAVLNSRICYWARHSHYKAVNAASNYRLKGREVPAHVLADIDHAHDKRLHFTDDAKAGLIALWIYSSGLSRSEVARRLGHSRETTAVWATRLGLSWQGHDWRTTGTVPSYVDSALYERALELLQEDAYRDEAQAA